MILSDALKIVNKKEPNMRIASVLETGKAFVFVLSPEIANSCSYIVEKNGSFIGWKHFLEVRKEYADVIRTIDDPCKKEP